MEAEIISSEWYGKGNGEMKIYLRITYGWLKLERSIDELDRAITEALTPFGFKQTGSSVDSMVRDLSFEADEFDIPADKKPGRPKTTT
jgi:hypothetical protein